MNYLLYSCFWSFICVPVFCMAQENFNEKVQQDQAIIYADNSATATLKLSTNIQQGEVAVKLFGDTDCNAYEGESMLANLDKNNDFSNPIVKKLQITSGSEIVFSFIYTHITPAGRDVCANTKRFKPSADKKYHAHFEFDNGWCKVRFLTLVNEGTKKESWEKYRFAKTNKNICVDKSDLDLLHKKQLK